MKNLLSNTKVTVKAGDIYANKESHGKMRTLG